MRNRTILPLVSAALVVSVFVFLSGVGGRKLLQLRGKPMQQSSRNPLVSKTKAFTGACAGLGDGICAETSSRQLPLRNSLSSFTRTDGNMKPLKTAVSATSRVAGAMYGWNSGRMNFGVVNVPELGAKIAVAPCPGKRERDVGDDLDQLKEWGASAVVTLVEAHELKSLRVGDIKSEAASRGIEWFHCPIPDFSGPGGAFEAAWVQGGAGQRVREILQSGGNVVVHCRGGIGRAGTISSRLLIELGLCSPSEALRRIREARPGAVETWDQENHVMSITPLKKK